MAEPTLSLTRDNLREEVGLKLGYGVDTSGWEPEQISRIDICIRSGLGRFYVPIVQDQKEVYEWSFLKLTATITPADDSTSDALPDDCDGIIDSFVVTTGDGTAAVIPVIPVRDLLKLRATGETKGVPKYTAIRIISTDPTTAQSQRYEVLCFPKSDGNNVLSYEYPVKVDTIGSTNTYLPGGASHSQTIIASCLAVAEEYLTPGETVHQQAFQQRLQASIEYDRRNLQTQRSMTWDLNEPTYGTWDWFKREVSGYLLSKWDTNLLTHSENAQVESLVQRGLKTFYYPPGQRKCWSFMYVSAVIEIADATPAYELPAGFTGLHGNMTFVTAGASNQPIREVTESELRASQISEATDGNPKYVCIREKTSSGASTHAGTAAFRYEAVFFPTPEDPAGTPDIQYRYKVSPAVLSSSVTVPYGSDVHAETMRQAMIAHASEQKAEGNQQEEWQKFQQALASSMFADVDVDVSEYDMAPTQQPPPQRQER